MTAGSLRRFTLSARDRHVTVSKHDFRPRSSDPLPVRFHDSTHRYYQFAGVHGRLEPLAKLGTRSHHSPQHVSSGQVANTVLLCQPWSLEGEFANERIRKATLQTQMKVWQFLHILFIQCDVKSFKYTDLAQFGAVHAPTLTLRTLLALLRGNLR